MDASVLVVDDEQNILLFLSTILSSEGYAVATASSGAAALERIEEHEFDVVLCDLMMPDINGLKLLEEVRRRRPETSVIIITAYGSLRSAVTALRLGATDYVTKPFDEDELLLRIRNAATQRQMRKQFEARTRELESFVFAISHDLAGHLVALLGFARRLDRQCSGQLGEDGRGYLANLQSSAMLMERLVTAISEFARIGKGGKVERVDLNALVAEVLKSFESAVQEQGVEVRIAADLPTVEIEWLSAYQLFHNLIGNAIKFLREGVTPFVEITAEENGNRHTIRVRDNGIGIRREDRQRIFELFSRGSDRQRVPGTGMGLAIARKVVEQAGGTIWVESEEQQGSTFSFTLPKAKTPSPQSASGPTTASGPQTASVS